MTNTAGSHDHSLLGQRLVEPLELRIRQLNLFSKSRHVLNFGIEAKLAERLEPFLRERVV